MTPLRPSTLFLATVLMGAGMGCDSGREPRAITAEFLDDKTPDGVAGAGEVIRVTLDRPPPAGFRPEEVRVWTAPPRTQLLVRASLRGTGSRLLDLELRSTPPPFETAGFFGGDPLGDGGPTGLGIDLGAAAPGEQWVDLQEKRGFPTLKRALWEDRSPPGARRGNLVVDQGDWIRLIFDRDVSISGGTSGEPPVPALVPRDLLLTEPEDRLDDGTVTAVFEDGDDPLEVRVVLGSNPRLTIAGRHRSGSRGAERTRSGSDRSSGIALNGTAVQPLGKIVDRRGWPGSISRGSVDIEFRTGYVFFEKSAEQAFPEPGHRTHHTVTPLAAGRALIAGGTTADGTALAQVLLFDPAAALPFTVLGEMERGGGERGEPAPEPRYLHTATLFPGEDGLAGTFDDFVVIAGGTDGNRSLGSLTVVRLDPSSPERITVEPLTLSLGVPRMQHTATFIPPDRLLVEGGRYSGPTGGGAIVSTAIVSTAELLQIETRGGKVTARKERDLQLLPRMRHTSTYLGKGSDGAHYVFTHGGVGARDREAAGAVLSPEEGVVLAAPTLVRIEPSSEGEGRAPSPGPNAREALIPLEFEYRFEMMRYDHRAAPVNFDPHSARDASPREVLIAGGSLRPPSFDPVRPNRKLFEPPRRAEDGARYAQGPTYSESAGALVLEFLPGDPARSVLHVVESPTGDRRVQFALVPLSYPGVLILGGENPEQAGELYSSGELYLPGDRRLLPLAVPLAAPRRRLGAYAADAEGGGTTVYVLGGSCPVDEAEFADIERLRLP